MVQDKWCDFLAKLQGKQEKKRQEGRNYISKKT